MGHRGNITPVERDRLDLFRQDKHWIEWLKTLHLMTRRTYEAHLFKLLGALNLTPTQPVEKGRGPAKQKELSKRVKTALSEWQEQRLPGVILSQP